MTGSHDLPLSPETKRDKGGRSYQDRLAIEGPKLSYRRRISNKAAFLGMALGYLGLVAILAMAPLWGQTLLLHDDLPQACTDFESSS